MIFSIKPSSYTAETHETVKDPIAAARNSKPKKPRTKKLSSGEEMVTRVENNDESVPLIKTEVPYITSYEKTQNMLDETIKEIDLASAEIRQDIDDIRNSKTMKSKYTYLANLQSARATILGQRLSAIKEINATITKAHDLDAKRDKEYRAARMNEQDDVAAMEKLYDSFVNTPVGRIDGQLVNPLTVNTQNLTLANPNMMVSSILQLQQSQDRLENFVNNMTEEQAIMFIEDNPAIEEVVLYNPNTGESKFSYYDFSINQPVTIARAKDITMFIDGLTFNWDTLTARSRDLGHDFKIIIDNTMATVMNRVDQQASETINTGVDGDSSSMSGY